MDDDQLVDDAIQALIEIVEPSALQEAETEWTIHKARDEEPVAADLVEV